MLRGSILNWSQRMDGHLAAETQKYWKNAGIQEGKAQVRGKAGKQAIIKTSTLSNTWEITPWTYFSPLGEDFQITPFQEQHPNSKGNKHQWPSLITELCAKISLFHAPRRGTVNDTRACHNTEVTDQSQPLKPPVKRAHQSSSDQKIVIALKLSQRCSCFSKNVIARILSLGWGVWIAKGKTEEANPDSPIAWWLSAQGWREVQVQIPTLKTFPTLPTASRRKDCCRALLHDILQGKKKKNPKVFFFLSWGIETN